MIRTAAALLSLASLAAADVLELAPQRDNTLFENSMGGGTNSNGAGPRVFAGLNGQGLRRRAVLAFDIAGSLPAGAVVQSATLTLNMSQSNAPAFDFSLHRLTSDWGEGASNAGMSGGSGTAAEPGDATWEHTFFPGTFWATLGGDFVAAPSATTSVDGPALYTWTSAALAADVQAMLDDPATDFGWILKADLEMGNSSKRFDSREVGDAALRPSLEVVFDLPCAATSFCTSSANSTGSAAVLAFVGSCAVADDDLRFQVSSVPNGFGVLSRALQPGNPTPFGNGLNCLAGSATGIVIGRPERALGGGLDLVADPLRAQPIVAGSTWYFQAWFRDRAAGGAGFDTSDGIELVIQ